MTPNKLTLAALLLAGLLAAGGLLAGAGPSPSGQKDPPPAKPAGEAALEKAMRDEARKVFEQTLARYRGLGVGPQAGEELYQWSVRWLEADLDLAGDAAAKTAALKTHLDHMKEVEKMATNLARTGQGRESDAAAGRYYRAQAELWVARGRAK